MTDLPKAYKACIYDQPGKISTKVVSLDVPEPGPGEVLVKLSVLRETKNFFRLL
jgi:propanol-preferring alcohol dehydrogenase